MFVFKQAVLGTNMQSSDGDLAYFICQFCFFTRFSRRKNDSRIGISLEYCLMTCVWLKIV